MNCDQARKQVWPPERPQLCGDEVYEARRHVEECEACRDFFAQDRTVLEMLDRLRSEQAPKHVRERVWDVLARERAGMTGEPEPRSARRFLWGGLLGAAAVFALLAVAYGVGTSARPLGRTASEDGDVFVEDYLRRAVGADHIVTSDRTEVSRFIARELGMPLMPLEGDGLEIARAEICLLEGQRGVMVEYRRDGRTIAHYMIPREGGTPRDPARLERVELEGMPAVVTWSNGTLEQALVADLGVNDLVDLAKSGSERRAGR